jgi:hypothetical protein
MTGRRPPFRRAKPDVLATLLGLAPGMPGAWHTSASNIAMQPVAVRAAGIEWRVHLHAYAVRCHLTDARKVEVTVGLTISTNRPPSGRARRARAEEWQQGIAKRLADLGFRGSWGHSRNGPFAHFTKRVRSVSSVPVAIRQLQRVRF